MAEKDSVIKFKYNKDGVLEAWENGRKIGEVVTMGDMINGEEEGEK